MSVREEEVRRESELSVCLTFSPSSKLNVRTIPFVPHYSLTTLASESSALVFRELVCVCVCFAALCVRL